MENNTDALIQFGKTLEKHRKEKGFSYRELARRCNVEYSNIGRIEKGRVSIQLLTVFELAKGLEIHPRELFNFEFDPHGG